MSIRLTVFLSDEPVLRKTLPLGESYVVGRGDGADLRIPDARVSRTHARLTPRPNGAWLLEDLASKNGTRLDGKTISESLITSDAWADIGGVYVFLELVDDQAIRNSASKNAKRAASAKRSRESVDVEQNASCVFEHLARSVIDLSQCDRASIWLSGKEQEPSLAHRFGKSQPPESLSTICDTLYRGVDVISNDVEGVGALARRESIMAGGVRALICFPLKVTGAPCGAVYADSQKTGKCFSQLDIELLHGLADHAALTLASLNLRDQIANIAAQR